MDFEIVPAHDLAPAEQVRVVNAGFAGYVGGWHDFDAEALARFLSSQGTDLFLSRFVRAAGDLVGFGYINRTGRILRLSGMAMVPTARGSGAAGHLLTGLFNEARARGDTAMTLEVIEQNPRGHALYRRHGFRELTRLFGWRRRPGDGAGEKLPSLSASEVEEIAVTAALDWPCALNYPEIPWQISRHAAAKAPNTRAFRAANICIVLGDPGAEAPLRVHALLSQGPDGMQWSELRALLAALFRRFPDREFFAPAIFPEAFGDALFAPLGFTREPLSQFLMRRDF